MNSVGDKASLLIKALFRLISFKDSLTELFCDVDNLYQYFSQKNFFTYLTV